MLKFVLLIGFIGHCTCVVTHQQAPSNWGPYPDSHTPAAEYGPPSTPNPAPAAEYGAPPPTPSIQIEPENYEFAGQVVQVNTPAPRPSYIYLTAKPVQQFGQLRKPTPSPNKAFLPKETPPKPFHSTTLNTGEVVVNTQQSAKLTSQPTFFASTQHLPQFQEIRQFRPIAQQQQQQVPASEYGPPPSPNPNVNPYPYPYQPSSNPVVPLPPPPPVHETVDETPFTDEDEQDDTTDPTVIAVANANGQYYILSKDNTLQRVAYRTEQTKEDSINNGFTAHLRYSLVEPIRDPIYGYDDQGHLVRIYNKK